MKRRDTLKAIGLSVFGVAATEKIDAKNLELLGKEKPKNTTGMKTIAILSDIIIPADKVSGSATQSGVPDFIEFMAKDTPSSQTPLRGGIRWLNNQCEKRFDKIFNDCSQQQRLEVIDDIAYPEKKNPEFTQGISFFNRMRNLVVTGFYTSKIGIADVGYVGNTPNTWAGVPKEVLTKHGF
jgi:hypothetical protein